MSDQPKKEDFYGNPVSVLYLFSFIVSAMAEPYRLLFYRLGTRGLSAVGYDTAAGLFLAFHIAVQWFGPPRTLLAFQLFRWAWTGMVIGGVLHQLGAIWRFRRNHRGDIGRFWFGPGVEPIAVAALAYLLWPLFPGGASWLLAAYACSTVQIWQIRARYALQAARLGDGQREAEQVQKRL